MLKGAVWVAGTLPIVSAETRPSPSSSGLWGSLAMTVPLITFVMPVSLVTVEGTLLTVVVRHYANLTELSLSPVRYEGGCV